MRPLEGLAADATYTLRAQITDDGRQRRWQFASKPFKAADLKDGRIAFTAKWKPEKLWDIAHARNMYHGQPLAAAAPAARRWTRPCPVRFGFREFWIDGRDFYLNGTRIFLSSRAAGQRPGRRGVGHLRRRQGEPAAPEEPSASTWSTRTTTAASRGRTSASRKSCGPPTTWACSSRSRSRTSASTTGRPPTPTRRTATPATRSSTCAWPATIRRSSSTP